MQPVRVPYNNAEYDEEEDNKSRYSRSKLGRKDNSFGDFQNNNDDRDKDKDVNAGYDTIYVDNLVGEYIDNNLVIQDISDHYCGPPGFKEGV